MFSALRREGDDVGVLLKMVRVLRDGEAPDKVHQGYIAELYIGAADLVQVTTLPSLQQWIMSPRNWRGTVDA